jgi:hypothetical protein
MSTKTDTHSPEALLSQLERSLIDKFVRARGYDPDKLADLPAHVREHLLADASVYASGKLAEVDARSHFLDEIHDGTTTIAKRNVE